MAFVQVTLTEPTGSVEEVLEDVLAVSRDAGGIIVLKGEKLVVRVSFSKKEAGHIAAQLSPHIP